MLYVTSSDSREILQKPVTDLDVPSRIPLGCYDSARALFYLLSLFQCVALLFTTFHSSIDRSWDLICLALQFTRVISHVLAANLSH